MAYTAETLEPIVVQESKELETPTFFKKDIEQIIKEYLEKKYLVTFYYRDADGKQYVTEFETNNVKIDGDLVKFNIKEYLVYHVLDSDGVLDLYYGLTVMIHEKEDEYSLYIDNVVFDSLELKIYDKATHKLLFIKSD